MGNSQGKESRTTSPTESGTAAFGQNEPTSSSRHGSASQRPAGSFSSPVESYHTTRSSRRSSRHDVSLFGLGGHREPDPADPMARRETKAEREARKLAKERELREKERERSLKEESVDGGYLVTMGVYTGPEDFSKPTVRQLQLERRLAPFWRGLNDFNDMWTEHQITAAARGLPIPPPDEAPPEEAKEQSPQSSDMNVNHLTVPISSRSPSFASEHSNVSPSLPRLSLPAVSSSPFGSPPSTSTSPFFRGRAKTLAALTSTSRNNSQQDMSQQEIQLPKDPNVNGQRLEVFLYKDAAECPICFMYYPPYLNKTRCCDQPICSECFVQIKRPDPHPPEHGDPNDTSAQQGAQEPQQDYMLVSEPATCPFCKTQEFGITYDPPPFRRGLAYASSSHAHPLASAMSAMSSSSSLNSQGPNCHSRRRTTSLGANEPNVVTTDKIRPDWAKKLSDARAHALRRAAAATALHNAAYVLGNVENGGRFSLGRRRRTLFGNDSPGGSSNDIGTVGALLAAAERHGSQDSGNQAEQGSQDLFPGRYSSRRSRLEDLEELMMMEAIRLSLAAEEERKRKEDKEAEKQKKKEDKQKAKEQKKADKAAKKSGMYPAARNASNFSQQTAESSTATAGKGKSVDRSGSADSDGNTPFGFIATPNEPSAMNNGRDITPKDDAQRHLEASRAQIGLQETEASQISPANALGSQSYHRQALRQLSNASSSASSFVDSANLESPANPASSFNPSPNASGLNLLPVDSAFETETPPGGGAGTEPMFNFRSLAAVIGDETKHDNTNRTAQIEHVVVTPPEPAVDTHESSSPAEWASNSLEDSALTLRPTIVGSDGQDGSATEKLSHDEEVKQPEPDSINNTPRLLSGIPNQYDAKHYGNVSVLEGSMRDHSKLQRQD